MPLTVYKSSAGSGKTYTLVLEYLLMVLKYPTYYRNILAATFTNKAANEMKKRVLKALYILSSEKYQLSEERKILAVQLSSRGLSSPSNFKEEATRVFTSILHHYNDFNIVTLDSFTHRLVKTFARDLGLPPLFEVKLEEMELSKELVDELISKVGEDEFITTLLLNLVEDNFENETHWRFDRTLTGHIKELLTEESFFNIPSTDPIDPHEFQEIRASIAAFIRKFDTSVGQAATSILELIQGAGLSMDELDGKSKGIWSVLMKLANGAIALTLSQKTIKNSFEKDNPFIGKSASLHTKSAFEKVSKDVFDLFSQIRVAYESSYNKYRVYLLLRKNIYSFALQNRIADIMQDLIVRNQQVPISEFNKRIANVLFQSPAAYIYERIGEKYKSFMLDEFQDTSVLQWQNIIPLIENSLASGNSNLIVGDGKQSIYRFRSGEFQQFMDLPNVYKAVDNQALLKAEQTFVHNYIEKNLNTNYRSSRVIVDFNNDFFDFIAATLNDAYRKVYASQRQSVTSENKPGRVHIAFYTKEQSEFASIKDRMESEVLDIIKQQLEDGFEPKDIAILVRKKAQGNAIAGYLGSNGIEVVSSDSLLLKSSPVVRLLINSLRFVYYPEDAVNRWELLLNLLEVRGITYNTEVQNEIMSYQCLPDTAQIQYLTTVTNTSTSSIGNGLFDQAEDLVRTLQLADSPDPYLIFILEVIHGFQLKKIGGFDAFFDFWQENSSQLSLVVPELMNAVKIMTIHKAKGLEFPVVIFPYADEVFNKPTKNYLWVDLKEEGLGKLSNGFVKCEKALLETRFAYLYEDELAKTRLDKVNNLYVALTRAENRLYILATEPSSKGDNYAGLFKEFLQAKGIWNDEQKEYTIENNIPVAQQVVIQKDLYTAPLFVSTDWKKRIKVAVEPSIDAHFVKGIDAISLGNLFHEIMSRISYAEDFPEVLAYYQRVGSLSEHQFNDLNELLSQLVSNVLTSHLFSREAIIRNEVELLNEAGKVFRTDRFVEFSDNVIVVDYKTGKELPEHHDQLKEYLSLAASLQTKPVEAIILYVNDLKYWKVVRV